MPPSVALCAIMRDEGRYVLEWIAYHRAIGFDPIVIYDNQSTDNMPAICRSLAEAGLITYIPWPDPIDSPVHGPQIYAYEHAAAHLQAEWLCCLDADEFLVLETARTVQDLIGAAGQACMPIALNWRNFGSGGAAVAGAGLVMERFLRCGGPERVGNNNIKTLGPAAALRAGARVHIHGWRLVDGQYYVDAAGVPAEIDRSTWLTPPRWRGAWINHYIVKSREEFEVKRLRGNASIGFGGPQKFSRTYDSYFVPYDQNDLEDRTIQRFSAVTADGMKRLGAVVAAASLGV